MTCLSEAYSSNDIDSNSRRKNDTMWKYKLCVSDEVGMLQMVTYYVLTVMICWLLMKPMKLLLPFYCVDIRDQSSISVDSTYDLILYPAVFF